MKKTLGKVVLIALILVLALISAFSIVSAATTVYVDPANNVVLPGASFDISIKINTTEAIWANSIILNFDKNILNATSVVEGDFLKQGGSSTYPITNINNSIGEIKCDATRFGVSSGATGQGTLFIINFKVIGSGQSVLGLSKAQLLRYPDLVEIPAILTNGTVRMNNPPDASNLQLTPSLPTTIQDLIASYNYSDPDGDSESGTEIRWYKNAVLQSSYNDQKIVPSSATTKNEKWYFTVRPRDGMSFGDLKVSNNVTIQNSVPILQAIGNKTVNEGQLLQFTVSASDADGDSLVYTAIGLPSGATFQSKQFSWTPTYEQAGIYNLTFNVSDGTGSASEKISIIVNNVNRVPTIDWFSPSSLALAFREGFSLLFNHTSSDADGDSLVYSWKLDDIVKATTQSWLFSPDDSQCGLRKVKLEVSDAQDSVSKEWNVTVLLRGDVNSDKKVDIFDLASVGLCYGKNAEGNCKNADINPAPGKNGEPEGNNKIDIFDLATVGLNYGRSC